MNRDRNRVCKNCTHYYENECRRESPKMPNRVNCSFEIPPIVFQVNQQVAEIHIPQIGGHFEMNPWPRVKSDQFCSQWSDGSCEFCGRKE